VQQTVVGPLSVTLPVGLSVPFALHEPGFVTTREAWNACCAVGDEIAQTEPLGSTVLRV
jgi:hypothetical protein